MINIYTDGSTYRTNPGYGGSSVVIVYPDGASETLYYTMDWETNNRAEINAVIQATDIILTRKFTDVTIHSDSKLCIMCAQKLWKAKKNLDLFNILWANIALIQAQYNLTFNWVKGHSTTVGNILADSAAGYASEQSYIKANP